MARTIIIFPAIKLTGIQSKAVSPGFSPKNFPVIWALIFIEALGSLISFGVPVEPEVLLGTKGETEFHSSRKSKMFFCQGIAEFNSSNICCEKSNNLILNNLLRL